jgi:hypothetical protein
VPDWRAARSRQLPGMRGRARLIRAAAKNSELSCTSYHGGAGLAGAPRGGVIKAMRRRVVSVSRQEIGSPRQGDNLLRRRIVKLLLTSAGMKNTSIHDALVDLSGKPIAESNAVYAMPSGAGTGR